VKTLTFLVGRRRRLWRRSLFGGVVLEALLAVIVCSLWKVSASAPAFACFICIVRVALVVDLCLLADALPPFCSGGCFAAVVVLVIASGRCFAA